MGSSFNLKEKRSQLAQVLRTEFGIHNSKAWLIVKRVVEQDEEFIKLLKARVNDIIIVEDAVAVRVQELCLEIIDNLSGGFANQEVKEHG